jgi:hypothetical protein
LRLRFLSAAVAAAAVACARGDGLTAPQAASTSAAASGGRGSIVSTVTGLLSCPTSESATAAATIGPEGGVLVLDGHRFAVPAGAVAESTTFVMTAPAGRYLEVDVSAVGVERYIFLEPVTITLDLRRCPPSIGPFHAWYIDTRTKALKEDLGGVTDLLSRTHTFQTGHLSGYAVAT